jgi:uncharacterized protein (TIGR01244 family)
MHVELTRHDEDFATAGQIVPEQMAEIARLGFRAVIDNRPDGEGGPSQPSADELKIAAEEAGLGFVYQPVVGSAITVHTVEEFAGHLDALPKPVLAFCRSGARSERLYRLAGQASPQR